jgi:hypothetical protein
MTRRRKVTVDTSRIRPRVETFGSLQPGDVVKLTQEQGAFRFLSAAVDDEGGYLWVDLHGGTPGREQLRSVRCDRLKIPSDRQLARQRARAKE